VNARAFCAIAIDGAAGAARGIGAACHANTVLHIS
jgi:hypothetical protein